jgi:integrase
VFSREVRRLSPKTRHHHRVYAATYVRPVIGARRVRDVTPEVVLTWQRKLLKEGGSKDGKTLAPNTIRLARAPLAGAFKLAVANGVVAVNPVAHTAGPKARHSVPRHWSPEQARQFLALMDGDRTYPVWAFLMGAGLRIGELVALRWRNVDLDEGVVRVVEFSPPTDCATRAPR